MKIHCEEVLVQLIVTTRNDAGEKIREVTYPPQQPVKVLRNAETKDFWAEVDKAVAQIERQQREEATAAAKQGRSAPLQAVRSKRR